MHDLAKSCSSNKPRFVGEKICLNQVVLSLPASKAVIKKNAATEYADGLYPAFSASGQDVWLPDYRYDCNGVVVSAVGARCGKAFKASGKWNVVANTHPLALDEEKIDWDYAWRLLNNENWWIKSGSGQPFVKVRESLKRNIYLPPLSVQKKFAANLERVEKQIALTKQSLAELDSLVKSRFIEMFEDITEQYLLGERLETTSGGTPSRKHPEYYEGGSIPWLTSGEVNKGKIDTPDHFITEAGLRNSSAKLVPANSVVVAMYGATAGQVGLVTYETTTNQAVCCIKPNACVAPVFLRYALEFKKDWMIDQCAGGAQPNISQGIVKKVAIPDVTLARQQEFADFASQVDKLRFYNRRGH